jgi:AAA domain
MTHTSPLRRAKVITVLNFKGGVGKTHCAWLFTAVCQERGIRLLAIDTDTQARRAERHYRSVDPENRLVAGTLEKEWEQALNQQRQLQEEFERFQRDTPQGLTEPERVRIQSLANDLPALWHAPETTAADRKEIVRGLIDKVMITSQGPTEHIDVTIHWKGGFLSQHAVIRRVRLYDQLRDFEAIMAHVRAGHAAGLLSAQIAEQLQQAGFRTINPDLPWNKHMVLSLLRRTELLPGRTEKIELASDEWLLADLARELRITCSQLRRWMQRKHVHWRQSPLRGYYIVWADARERQRLRKLRAFFVAHSGINSASYPKELVTPAEREDVRLAHAKKRDG